MIKRCYDPDSPRYRDYGGRGITVCEEWKKDREAFIEWAYSSGYSFYLMLDRKDNDGNYSPENCRWVTPKQQARNTRKNVTDFDLKTRVCWVCKKEKPLTDYHKDKAMTEGHMYLCKECRSRINIENTIKINDAREKVLRETVDPFLPKLRCRVCGELKTTRHFHRNHHSKTGFRDICKPCRSKQRKLKRY